MLERRESKRPIIAVGILLFNQTGQILLGERYSRFGRGMMALPGGKSEKGETFKQSAERELLEESGLGISKVKFGKYISVAYENVQGLDGMTVGVFAKTESEPVEIPSEEIGKWGWYDLESLPSNLFPPSRRIIDNYKNKVISARLKVGL